MQTTSPTHQRQTRAKSIPSGASNQRRDSDFVGLIGRRDSSPRQGSNLTGRRESVPTHMMGRRESNMIGRKESNMIGRKESNMTGRKESNLMMWRRESNMMGRRESRKHYFLSHIMGLHYRDETMSFRSSEVYPPKEHFQLENTYKMEPDKHFPVGKVEKVIQEVLEHHLQDVDYDPTMAGVKAKTLSDMIKDRVKSLKADRYKIISWVLITQRGKNTIHVASRGLWDNENDTYAESVFENSTLHAVGTVFATYQE